MKKIARPQKRVEKPAKQPAPTPAPAPDDKPDPSSLGLRDAIPKFSVNDMSEATVAEVLRFAVDCGDNDIVESMLSDSLVFYDAAMGNDNLPPGHEVTNRFTLRLINRAFALVELHKRQIVAMYDAIGAAGKAVQP